VMGSVAVPAGLAPPPSAGSPLPAEAKASEAGRYWGLFSSSSLRAAKVSLPLKAS
jgi:hypothetical protein